MNGDLAAIYTTSVHNSLGQYACWPIGEALEVGDYGKFQGHRFVREGNLKNKLKVKLARVTSKVKVEFDFKSSGVEEVHLDLGGSARVQASKARKTVAQISAKTTIKFTKAESVYFRATKLTLNCLDNLEDVCGAVLKAFKNGTWDGKDHFIHSFFESDGTTVLISSHDDASIEIQGSGRDAFDLADAKAGLKVTGEKNVGLKTIAKGGFAPLFGVCGIRPRNRWLGLLGLGGKTVQPLLQTTLTKPESVPTPGNILLNLQPEISPRIPQEMGKSVEDVYQVVEVP